MRLLSSIPYLSVGLILLLGGCQTRSISDAGYERDSSYRGELTELQVLGVVPDGDITEDDIAAALDARPQIALKRGATVVFVQSGAQFPDELLMDEARKNFNAVPLSGVPWNPYVSNQRAAGDPNRKDQQLNQSLRLAAARAGAEVLVVYWGTVDISRDGYATRTVSWVPVVGWVIPDETREMRIRIKAAVIDVRSGAWEFLIPEVHSDKKVTNIASRADKHESMVEKLKASAYSELVKMMETRYLDR